MRRPPREIGLFGLFGCGNSGNDGSLEAMIRFLRRVRPDASLVCICPSPDLISAGYGLPAVSIGTSEWSNPVLRRLDRLALSIPRLLAGWIRTFWQVRNLDLLIVPGTGILDDFAVGPRGAPYGLFRWCICAKLCRAEIWLVSIGAGPIRHPFSRRLLKIAAATAQYRSYRDRFSKAFMTSIGFDARADPIYPDIAFSLPTPVPKTTPDAAGARLAVAVGVMRYRGWRDDGAAVYVAYLTKVKTFILWLLEQGHTVRIMTGDRADRGAVDDLLAAMGSAAQAVRAEATLSLHDLMEQIAQADIVIATRFHNVVCSHKLERPIISIGYADKNDALQREAGLGAFCQYIETLDVERLVQQFECLVRDRGTYVAAIRNAVATRHHRLNEQEAILAQRLTADRARPLARTATAVNRL